MDIESTTAEREKAAQDLLKSGKIEAAIAAYAAYFSEFMSYQKQQTRAYIDSFEAANEGRKWRAKTGMFEDRENVSDVFSSIYAKGMWGHGSGGGSSPQRAAKYAGLLQYFINKPDVKKVVDLGCGDWAFSRHLDFSSVEYKGYDVVKSVIETNSEKFSSDNVSFELGDATKVDLGGYDLVVCRDVMQHLSNKNVGIILKNIKDVPLALITNDFTLNNTDCDNGDTRPVNVTASPFDFDAVPVLAISPKMTFLYDSKAS